MPWLNINTLNKKIKSIGLMHPGSPHIFDKICILDPTFKDINKFFSIPRPIYENYTIKNLTNENKRFIEYNKQNIPIFGSFGFACGYKGFVKMIELINNQYDSCIIKIVMPSAAFYPNNYFEIEKNKCLQVKRKSGVELKITNSFFTTDELLLFLESNTMNIFLYDYVNPNPNVGISSVIDLALSVNTPIGISNSYMFRNIYSDEICLYKTSIKNCLINSNKILDKYREYYSYKNFLEKLEYILNS
jgi:hypothetical protein